MLTILPTPIGNLKDMSFRGVEALTSASFIIAENPAHTAKLIALLAKDDPETTSPLVPLLKRRGKVEMVQFAEHNETKILPKLLERLEGENAVLVSDAGTPGISDPGFRLVRACWENGIKVDSLPGPSAVVTALAGSGLPTDKFFFVGFLPKTENKVVQLLTQAKDIEATLVAYDSPERITKTLGFIAKAFPNAQVFVGRELTKLHQTFYRNTAESLAQTFPSSIKGEITLCVSFK